VFRLGGPGRPTDGDSLARAVREGLAESLAAGSRAPSVTALAAAWPRVERLAIDLTGSVIRGDRSPFGARGEGGEPGPTVAEVAIRGRPVTIGGTEVTLAIDARAAAFTWAEDEAGAPVLGLDRYEGGELSILVAREEIERRVEEGIRAKAQGQGAKILAVELSLTGSDENRVTVELAVTLRMMFKAKIRAKGELVLDDDLDLVVSSAEVSGDGMAGRTVAGIIRPRLSQLVEKEFALGSLLPPGIELADVRLRTEGGLDVRGRLAPSAP